MHLRRNVLVPLIAAALTSLTACTPAQRAAFPTWFAANVAAAPEPISDTRCPPGPIKDELVKAFGFAAPWAESVAWRESNCRADPPHNNPSRGVMQLQGHNDLVSKACPGRDPHEAVIDPHCNIAAAKRLFDSNGIAPWTL